MKRLLPPWALLMLAAIFVLGVMVWIRVNPPEAEEKPPLEQAADDLNELLGLEVAPEGDPGGGVPVTGVRRGGPAEQVGMGAGDRIVACGVRSVWHAYELMELVGELMSAGQPILLLVERDGEYRRVVFSSQGPPPGGGQVEGGG